MTEPAFELAVAGGGPAGSAVAALLARDGRKVVLLERDAFPRDKLCGEVLSGEARTVLDRLGCLDEVLRAGPPEIRRAVFFAPGGPSAAFELPKPALGVSRLLLDRILLDNARRAGAEVRERSTVTGLGREGDRRVLRLEGGAVVEARAVIAAHGREGALDRRLERPSAARPGAFVGLKRHHRARAGEPGRATARRLRDAVELRFFAGGYCGTSFVEEGKINVCMLIEKDVLEAGSSTRWEGVCEEVGRRCPSFKELLAALEPAEPAAHAVAQVGLAPKEPAWEGTLFLGDSAGMIAPLCGDGQAIALRSAAALADLLAGYPRPLPAALPGLAAAWAALWRREFGLQLFLGRALQATALKPSSCDRLVRACAAFPSLGRAFFAATRARA